MIHINVPRRPVLHESDLHGVHVSDLRGRERYVQFGQFEHTLRFLVLPHVVSGVKINIILQYIVYLYFKSNVNFPFSSKG